MKISVVIPTYRRPKLLVRCLNALICQQFNKDDYEIIVVSDGPDQATAKAMALWTDTVVPQIRFIQTAEKKGPAASRNAGWMSASGNLIAFTDDDCIPGSGWLQTIWSTYKGEQYAAFTGKVVVPRSERPTDYELNTSHLEKAEFITANCICTRATLEKVGGFDERFCMAWREDSDLHFKLILHQIPIRQIPALVTHPVRKAPWGISIKEQKKGIYNALLYKKYPTLFRQRIKPKPSWNYYAMVALFFVFAGCAVAGSFVAASIALASWLILLVAFIEKRLADTARDSGHVAEMIFTSALIPFAAVFWTLYGSFKFKVLYI